MSLLESSQTCLQARCNRPGCNMERFSSMQIALFACGGELSGLRWQCEGCALGLLATQLVQQAGGALPPSSQTPHTLPLHPDRGGRAEARLLTSGITLLSVRPASCLQLRKGLLAPQRRTFEYDSDQPQQARSLCLQCFGRQVFSPPVGHSGRCGLPPNGVTSASAGCVCAGAEVAQHPLECCPLRTFAGPMRGG